MTPQPRDHEDPRWDSGATYGERITWQPSLWPTTPRKEELRGEALRRAWLDASYRVQPEPPDASILADWDHEDCAICAPAPPDDDDTFTWTNTGYRPRRQLAVNTRGLAIAISVAILCWGILVTVAWLTWQAVA